MIELKFPDGASREYPDGATGRDVAASISPSLAKRAALVEINGQQWDLDRPLESGGAFRLIMRDDPAALETIRHDAAHVLAQAVQELFPGTQVTIGPSIEDGFYYDFARDEPFSIDDFPKIEAKMREIIQRAARIVREEWNRDEAIAHFEKVGEHYKAEIIRDLPEGEVITLYRQGDWLDLCRGPHFPSTKHVGKAFKLTKLAGAYWRGDHRNAQLQRMYGTAYLQRVEEAEKRDHRKIGRQMELFHMQEEGRGMVFWHPKGWVLWQVIEAYMRRRLDAAGYVEVKTPQVLDRKFWEASGHWEKYRPNMFVCETVEGEELSLFAVTDGTVVTFPIAGSRPRGANPAADKQLAEELLADPDQRAQRGLGRWHADAEIGERRFLDDGEREPDRVALQLVMKSEHRATPRAGQAPACSRACDALPR